MKDLGLVAGLVASHVGSIERGEREDPASSTLAQLSSVLGSSMEYLLFGFGKPPTPRVLGLAVSAAVSKMNRSRVREGLPPIHFVESP